MKKIVVIGGVAAGLKAASKAGFCCKNNLAGCAITFCTGISAQMMDDQANLMQKRADDLRRKAETLRQEKVQE